MGQSSIREKERFSNELTVVFSSGITAIFEMNPLGVWHWNSANQKTSKQKKGEMRNAHERFGVLELTRRVRDTTNEIQVQMDRLILEPGKDSRATAHLISVIAVMPRSARCGQR